MRSVRATTSTPPRQFRSTRAAHPRRGYSLIETMVASFLAALLGILLALSCATFGALRSRSNAGADHAGGDPRRPVAGL